MAVISDNSLNSNWVKKELSYAITSEVEDGKVRVLPAVISKCELPYCVRDKLYADFRDTRSFSESAQLILRSIKRFELKYATSVNSTEGVDSTFVGKKVSFERERYDFDIIADANKKLGYYFLLCQAVVIPLLIGTTILGIKDFTDLGLSFFATGIVCGFMFVSSAYFAKAAINEDKNILIDIDEMGIGNPFTSRWFKALKSHGHNKNFRYYMLSHAAAVTIFFIMVAFMGTQVIKIMF